MASTGYIQVRAYTSFAQLPLQDVAILITDPQGNAIAMRQTDRNGKTDPIPIQVPDLSASLPPDTGIIPYTNVNVYARLENYEQIKSEAVQVFPSVITTQDLEMIPLSELPDQWSKKEIFRSPPQNL